MPQGTMVIYPVTLHEGIFSGPQSCSCSSPYRGPLRRVPFPGTLLSRTLLEKKRKGIKNARRPEGKERRHGEDARGGLNGQQPLCQLEAGSQGNLRCKGNGDQLARPDTGHPLTQAYTSPHSWTSDFYLQKKRKKIAENSAGVPMYLEWRLVPSIVLANVSP